MDPALQSPSRIEPCLLDDVPGAILDLVAKLSADASILGARLHPRTASGLAEAVRVMNCYYSNLIEGRNTTPREIERALDNQFAEQPERRDLQIEARAHIRIQRGLDGQYDAGLLPEPADPDFIRRLHRDFYEDAPASMLLIRLGDWQFSMKPGVFRSAMEHEVSMGRH